MTWDMAYEDMKGGVNEWGMEPAGLIEWDILSPIFPDEIFHPNSTPK